MTTSRPTGGHRWSRIMRLLAPGPVTSGLTGYVDPAVWRAIEEARRNAAPPQAKDHGMARGSER